MKGDHYLIHQYRIYLFTILLIVNSLRVHSEEYQISYLSVQDGLSQNEVTSIIQDKYGFMWFGTRGGLNRYDGYTFKHFKPDKNNGKSLNCPSIERLYLDRKGDIWIGTKSGGYSIYDCKKEHFYHLHKEQSDKLSRVLSFHEDVEGNMWMGSWQNGMHKWNVNKDSLMPYFARRRVNSIVSLGDSIMFWGAPYGLRYLREDGKIKAVLFKNKYHEVTKMLLDATGENVWIVGWELPLIRYNIASQTFQEFNLPDNKGVNRINTYSLLEEKEGNLWVGTWGNGLYYFDVTNKLFTKVEIEPKDAISSNISYDVILDIYQDQTNAIWIGTNGGGVVRLSNKSKFETARSLNWNNIKDQHVSAVIEDIDGVLWVGTKGGGLFFQSKDVGFKKVGYLHKETLKSVEGEIVKCLFQDEGGNLWVSMEDGIYVVTDGPNGNRVLVHAADFFNSPDLHNVLKAQDFKNYDDELWIATQQTGLFVFDNKQGKYQLAKKIRRSESKSNIGSIKISSLCKDQVGRLWVTTYNGLYLYQPVDSVLLSLDLLLTDAKKTMCNIILCSHIDKNNNLWFGTPCSLNKITEGSEGYLMKEYTKTDGLSDDYINAILSDDSGNVWVSTNAGLSKLSVSNGEIRNYNVADGVGGLNFCESSCYKNEDGLMYFGAHSDLTIFHPDNIKDNQSIPPLVITDFKVMNKDVSVSSDGILPVHINELKLLTLSHKEKEFSLEFSALDFKAPENNQYAYWLEGRDDKTIYIGRRRHISFSNLSPGDYILHLKGANSNGVWSDTERLLNIKVLPAPWRTVYAIAIYILIIFGVVVLIVSVGRKQVRLAYQARMEKILREKDKEANEYKLRFYTDISHELRTPLTLILAPVKELLNKDKSVLSPDYVEDKIKLIYQNTSRLYNLVNQLLEFRKAEVGKLKLQASENEIVSFIDRLTEAFEDLIHTQNVNFEKVYKAKDTSVYFDAEFMRVIINNLLSNAIKFAANPGYVRLMLSQNDKEFIINITNDGKGIDEIEQRYLFERFYRAVGTHNMGSSGIGLALVKKYVDLHKGEVKVERAPGGLTTFTVILKKGRQHLSEDDIKQVDPNYLQQSIAHYTYHNANKRSLNTGTKGAKVLVVEDNEEVRNYVGDLLSEFYDIVEAKDGAEGYNKIIEHMPNLVVSDVMMPLMDGFELCHRIKTNDIISHIPVVLLTAKVNTQDQLFGARKGADVYLTKPFDPLLLIEKVKLLIASREKLSLKFSKKVLLEPHDIEISTEEGEFLDKAIVFIEKHIGDFSFDPDLLADEMAMSVSTLYRKTKRLAKKTPGEFIRDIRIKHAAKLLAETELSVSEIAERVGYQDLKNFRRIFRATFELNPLQYRKEQKA
ncbi:hybrid sensor histidine kinase/response regulator transcription factor [Marinifilum caeruleilacunae]|uniref:histidine kinase n=1 Tax=Marinifilum caeruleilacunae TaxID=2499076 RepID=A0ABX1X013_9BACT|nr:two-component regulator propeller domain-containing protein [Marinifilum caeruleilacunae]NOU61758.1 hybrid sensor histidine kinase/response regulator [Marinifilum caeruleilacunae]